MSSPYREAAPGAICPRCGLGLTARPVMDVTIDECVSCQGAFVPTDLLPRFSDGLDLAPEVLATFAPGKTVPHPGGPLYVKCPRCQTVMNRRQFAPHSKVIVDVCRDHGTWFDAAELRAVAELAAGGGLEQARAAEDREARERKERARAEVAALLARSERPDRSLLEFLLSLLST